MSEQVGTLLWEIRTATDWTLGRLAQQSGISKATLSRWEAGKRQPRVAELGAVLDALGASPAQRSLALARIDVPSALRQLRQPSSSESDNLGAPLSAGDLLRAMRARGGWTQEQVAVPLGIARHTLARWELGERLPDTEQMQSLCYALGAREEEIIALTSGRFGDVPAAAAAASASAAASNPMDWEEKESELLRRVEAVNENRVGGLEELHYIQLDREVWHWALREPAARLFLARLRVYHSHYHRLHQRWDLSRTLARQAHQSLRAAAQPETEADLVVFLRLAILQAAAEVHGGARPAPERGVRRLSAWVDRSRDVSPAYQAWILSDVAKYRAMSGSHSEALVLAERACELVAQNVHAYELFLRRSDYGSLLLQAGRVEESLRVLPDPLSFGTSKEAVDALLLRVEALGRLGHLAEAQDGLECANTLIEAQAQAQEPQRQRAQELAERF